MRIKYYCDTCDRSFDSGLDAIECEAKHEKNFTKTKLIISHQPEKEQVTLRFIILKELYYKFFDKWKAHRFIEKSKESEKKMDFEEFLIKNFESPYKNVFEDKNKLELDKDQLSLISIIFSKISNKPEIETLTDEGKDQFEKVWDLIIAFLSENAKKPIGYVREKITVLPLCKGCNHVHNQLKPSMILSPKSNNNYSGYLCSICDCKELLLSISKNENNKKEEKPNNESDEKSPCHICGLHENFCVCR